MSNSVMISNSNQYAAYTAASKNDANVSELSKMLRGEKTDGKKASQTDDPSMNMDKFVISKEALDRLNSLSQIR